MRPDDEDDETGLSPPPDPSLRAWRHPSEIAAADAAAARLAAGTSEQHRPRWNRAALAPRSGLALATTVAVALAALAALAGLQLNTASSSDVAATGNGGGGPAPNGSARSLLTADLAATALSPTPSSASTADLVATTLLVTTTGAPTTSAPVASTAGAGPLSTTTTALTARTATTLAVGGGKVMAVEQGVWADVGGMPIRLAAFTLMDGMIVTSASAIDGHHQLTLAFGPLSAPVTLVGSDPVTDVAVLAVADDGRAVKDLIDALDEAPIAGTTVTGVVVQDEQTARNKVGQRLYGLLLTSTLCPEGATGAPLVDVDGNVVGVVVSSASPLLYVVPADEVALIGRSLTDHGTASPAWLGVDGETATDGTVRLRSVDPAGPGAKAGLLAGDEVASVDGVAVLDWHHFIYQLRQAGPGTEVTLVVNRNGGPIRLPVVIGSRTGH